MSANRQNLAGVELVDASEVAKIVHLSPRHVRRLVLAGRFIPPVKLGRKGARWPLDLLTAWIKRGCPRPADVAHRTKE